MKALGLGLLPRQCHKLEGKQLLGGRQWWPREEGFDEAIICLCAAPFFWPPRSMRQGIMCADAVAVMPMHRGVTMASPWIGEPGEFSTAKHSVRIG